MSPLRLRGVEVRAPFARPAIAGALLLVLSATGALRGQDRSLYESWRWAHFTTESGLPANHVHDVVETPAGTVWASTSRGLAWYDGYRWHPLGEPDGLPEERIEDVVPFGRDQILAVLAGRLYRGDRQGFQELPVEHDGRAQWIAAALPVSPTRAVLLAAETPQAPCLLYGYEDGRAEPLEIPSAPLRCDGLRQAWSTEAGGLWVNARRGLYRREGEEWVRKLEAPPILPLAIDDLVEGPTGAGLATVVQPPGSRALWEWDAARPPARSEAGRLHLVAGMDVGPSGEALVVYTSGDVRVRAGGNWSALDPPPPALTNVLFVRFRRDGDLWVGTKRGLFLHRRARDLWTYWTGEVPDPCNVILEILPARDGAVWLGTGRGVRIRRPDGSVERIEALEGVELDEVTGLAEDAEGHVWISSGSSFAGAYRWDGAAWRHFGAAEGLRAQRIHKIRTDRQGRLWFLGVARVHDREPGEAEPGAFVYDGSGFTPWGVEQGLISGRVYAFAEGLDGGLWFGTVGGLSRFRDGGWTHWTVEQGLRADKVFALAVDGEDRLWFAHQRFGLGFLDGGRPRYLTMDDGLVSDDVWGLTVDGVGRLWVATRGGLCAYREEIWACFDATSGLMNESLWPVSVTDERVYAGSVGSGVNVLDLRATHGPPPRVLLVDPIVEGGSVLLRWQAHAFWGEIAASDIETRHRLGGGGWSGWSRQREISLDDLAPGPYVFEVQAKGLLGAIDPSGSSVSFEVLPPFYRRAGFVLPVGLLLMTVAVLLGVLVARKRRHDAAIRASERKYRTIFENVQDAFFRTDPEGRILEISPSVERHLGLPRERVLGTRLQDHAADAGDAEALLASVLSAAEVRDHELRMKTRDGGILFVSANAHLLRGPDAETIGFEGMLRDVTEHKRAESALQRSRQELERRVRERTEELARANATLKAEVAERRAAERALRESEVELRHLSRRLIRAQEGERERLARELHDDLNQRLALFANKLHELGEEPPQSAAAIAASTRSLWRQTTELCTDVQRLAYRLHPSKLEDLGLVPAARSFCEEIAQQTGIRIHFRERDVPESLPAEVALCLYRVMQESLWNVARHSRAREAEVELAAEPDAIRLRVSDSGVGFDPEAVKAKGLGLLSMRERLQLVGGSIAIESNASGGTRVGARVPLPV